MRKIDKKNFPPELRNFVDLDWLQFFFQILEDKFDYPKKVVCAK